MSVRKLLAIAALGVGVTVLFASQAFSQHDGREGHDHAEHSGDQDNDAMTAMMMKAMTPGPHHKHLEPMIGEWNYVTKWRMSPDEPWQESKGTAKFESIMDGRFVTQHVIADEVDPDMQMKFEGHGLYGYDNVTGKHFSAWIDNMGTGLMVSDGSCDDSGKVMTLTGEFVNPMTGQKESGKSVTRIINNNKMVFEMYGHDKDGKEFQSLEVTSTRK